MSNITNTDAVVTESKLKDFYEDIKPFLGCPAYLTSEGNAEYYSTDEKVIGRWVDGKPLYQKTYIFDSTTFPNTDGNISLVANIDEIIDYRLVCHDSKYNTGYIPTNLSHQKLWQSGVPYDNSNGLFSVINYTTTPYSIQISGQGYYDWGSVDKAHLIVRYTKTTDSASTTIQDDSNEYSTTEKIIGKWIDGKPIYQKTFNISFDNVDPDKSFLKDYKYTFPTLQSNINSKNASMGVTNWYACNSSVVSKATLLWTNPSSGASFAGQTVSIPDCANYNAILVDVKYEYNQGSAASVYCLGFKNQLGASAAEASSNQSYGSYRAFTMKDTGVIFDNGYGIGNASSSSYNNSLGIPLHVYGINLSGVDASIEILNLDAFFMSTEGYGVKNDNVVELNCNNFTFEKITDGLRVQTLNGSQRVYATIRYTKTSD